MSARVSEEEKRRKARIRCHRWYHAHKHELRDKQKVWNSRKPRQRYKPMRELSDIERSIRLQRQKNWRANNKDKMRIYALRARYSMQLVIKQRLCSRIARVLRRKNRKSCKTIELIGCTWAFLKSHLESQFMSGMSWENRQLWHVDHIKPCAKFDLTDPVQQRACFNFTNLQPLWAEDNMKKWAHYVA